jgi:hypothetical protein
MSVRGRTSLLARQQLDAYFLARSQHRTCRPSRSFG